MLPPPSAPPSFVASLFSKLAVACGGYPQLCGKWVSCLLSLPASLFPIAFTGQCLLDAELLARLQVKGVSLDLLDDVLRQHLPLEAAERILKRLAFLELYLSQAAPS